MRPGLPSLPRPPRALHRGPLHRSTTGRRALLLATLATLAGCAVGPTAERRAARASGAALDPTTDVMPPMSPPPPLRGDPSTTTQGPAPIRVVDPLGIPPPPRGAVSTDAGSRLARPTPVGQLAPEEAPPVPDADELPPPTPVTELPR